MQNPYKLESMQNKNILVLGGLGFIGSNLANKCSQLGAKVTVFDSMLEPYGGNVFNIAEIKNKVELQKKDMRDAKQLEMAVREKDYIFNCAGQVSHVNSMKDPYLDIELNVVANMNLMEACRKYNDGARVVYAGTRAQIGKVDELPVTEKTMPQPVDVYGVNKQTAESYHLLYNYAYGLPTTSLRITNAFGERSQMKHGQYAIMNWFIRLALENKKIKVFGDGRQKRDYLYVEDVVDALLLAGQKKQAIGKYFIVSSGKTIEFIEMVKKIIDVCGSGSYEMVPWPEDRKRIETGDYVASYEKIKKELGWEPKTTFDEGLGKTVDFYKKYLKHYI